MREEGLSQTGAGGAGPPCACAHVCVYARRGSLGLQGVRGVRGELARVQEGTRSCGSEGRRWLRAEGGGRGSGSAFLCRVPAARH